MSAIIGTQAPESARAFSIAVPLTVGIFSSTLGPYLGGILYELSPAYPVVFAVCAALVRLLSRSPSWIKRSRTFIFSC